MTIRVYLMPRIGSGAQPTRTSNDSKRPKYLSLVAGNCTCFRYGPEPVCLFIADTTDAEHTALLANSDVRAMPDNLDTAVTNAARTAISNALESLNVPAQWIANGQTFRLVLRRLVGVFELLNNVEGRGLRFLSASLDSQISALPLAVRQGLQDAASVLQVNITGITNTTTLRVALATIGAQFDSIPVTACGTTL